MRVRAGAQGASVRSSGAEVTGNNIGAGNQTRLLWKSSHSLNPGAISPALQNEEFSDLN